MDIVATFETFADLPDRFAPARSSTKRPTGRAAALKRIDMLDEGVRPSDTEYGAMKPRKDS